MLKHVSLSQKRCITAALHCVLRELSGAVHEECEDPREHVEDAVDYLDLLIKERSEKGHTSTSAETLKSYKRSNKKYETWIRAHDRTPRSSDTSSLNAAPVALSVAQTRRK
ncbi:hypothetical protein EYF80_031073 [Liparis tanakae]|uniref:Uncharacterized protein n=1 Tax=Liparis tanakae TaxID=230148 RepID=A0A4Z2GYR3_9TELE|nr:hypothetical protein EYF80_031073 [Liparis tanakae]